MLAHSPHQIQDKELPAEIHPMAFLFISDKIRAEAPRHTGLFCGTRCRHQNYFRR